MITYLVAFLLAAACSFLLTPLVRDLALARGWVDDPTEARKVHVAPIPRVGGLAIAVAFFVPVSGLFFWDNLVSKAYLGDLRQVGGLFLGSVAIVGLGLVDDLRGLRPIVKLVVQVLVAGLAYGLGYRVGIVANPFGEPLVLGAFAFPVTVLWIVGVMNAINLMDGLDGLAGGISLFSVLTLFALGVINQNIIVGLSSIALAGALVGFLRYNFNPASVFMGDSGSLFLGYVLSVTAISGSAKSSTVVSLLIPTLALGLPMMDTLMAVFRRFISGRSIFAADRGHLHHRLLDLGMSHRQAVLLLYAACLVLAAGALALVYANSFQTALILAAFGVVTVVFSVLLGYASVGSVTSSVRYGFLRQRNLRHHLAVLDDTAEAIRVATSPSEALQTVVELAQEVGADGVLAKVALTTGGELERHEVRWPRIETEAFHGIVLEYPLDWALGDAEIFGLLWFRFDCDDEVLQLPESGGYERIALLLRDRLLTLALEGRALPFRPRLLDPV